MQKMLLLAILGLVLILVGAVSVLRAQWSDTVEESIAFLELPSLSSIDSAPLPTPLPVAIPTDVVIPQRTHVFQTFNNCGPASLSMLLSYFDRTVSQGEIGRRLRPVQNPQGVDDDKSVTLVEMAAEAERRGFVAYYRPNGSPELLRQAIASGYPVVIRTWLAPDEDIGHYRVVRGYNQLDRTFIQDDSLQGAGLSYTEAELTEIWQPFNYEFLVIGRESDRTELERIIGELQDERKAWELAAERVEGELRQNPRDIYARFNQSVIATRLGRYEAAVEAFEDVESRLPRRMLWYQIEPIEAYLELGEYDRVFAMSDAILNTGNRAYAELYDLRAEAYRRQGRTEEAEQEQALAVRYKGQSP